MALAGLAIAGGVALLRFGLAGNQRDLTPYVTTAERGVLSLITASGELLAVQNVNVSPRKQGLLDELLVDEGDAVQKDSCGRWIPVTSRIACKNSRLYCARRRRTIAGGTNSTPRPALQAGVISADDFNEVQSR